MVVLPAAVVLIMAPRVEHVVLVIVFIDIPGGVVVIVETACPVGTGGIAPPGCAKSSIPTLLRLEGEAIVLGPPKNEEDTPNPPAKKEPEVAVELVIAAVVLEVRRAGLGS